MDGSDDDDAGLAADDLDQFPTLSDDDDDVDDDENDGDLPSGSDDDDAELDMDVDAAGDASDQDDDDDEAVSSDEDDEVNEASVHKRDLERLKQTQPEFYQYLLDNDQSLLDFDDEDHEVEEEFDDQETQFIEEATPQKQTLDKDMVAKWEAELAEKETPNNIKRLVVAFRSSVQQDADSKSAGYVIPSATIHRKVVILAFKHVPHFLKTVLGESSNPTSSNKWKRVSAMVKVFMTNALKLFKDTTEPSMTEYLLQELHASVVYILPYPKLSKDYFRLLLATWGNSTHDALRVKAFAHIRDLAATHPKKFLEPTLKGTYMMFVKSSRRTTVHTLPTITLLTRCAAEAYGLDADMSYQYAFIYIRQLAIHLRSAMAAKTKEAYRQVYQWQYVHSIRFWANVLLTYAPKGSASPLTQLVYPLVQVMLGVIRLVPTTHYHPLHLHLLQSLTDLVRVCGVYVPLAPYFATILDAVPTDAKAKKSTLKPLYLPAYVKCPKQYAGTRVYAQSIRGAVHMVLLRYLGALSNHVAFPELSIAVVVALKANVKATKDANWSKTVQGLLDKIDENAKFIRGKRQAADVAPCDTAAVARFMAQLDPVAETPLGKFAASVEKVEAKRMEAVQASFIKDYDAFGAAGDDDESGKRGKKGKQARRDDSGSEDEDEYESSADEEEQGEDEDMDVDSDEEEARESAPVASKGKDKKTKGKGKGRRQSAAGDEGDDDFLKELKGMSVVMDDNMDVDSD
ncbi:Noc2p family-domain-containing protein [Catenaria anguillulae PL171]|uniref:Noc2p family-domain-containing protein n=1 Tax=Catenaria anguillulae PL171 TaxID=765915 RepID=A0A1Y2I5G4_9FUNG|nr:Noc2p family-domain-containing protein [Catenaria anguillulae PL171]